MTSPRNGFPQTLLARIFVLVSLLLVVSVATWTTLFVVAENEPHARQLAEMTVSVVNLTNASLLAAAPEKRETLLRDFAETEGVHVLPAEATDTVEDLPDSVFFRSMIRTARAQLPIDTRFAGAVNGQYGIWVRFPIDNTTDDYYWLMLPAEHAENDFPWTWLGWGGASLALALLVAWLIASRIASPLRTLSVAAADVGRGKHPAHIPETGATELRQLAKTFNTMADDLRRIETERTEVLAGLSHDLRTPLARLRLESEMSIADESAKAAVIDDIEQMNTIITQFLAYARSEGGEDFQIADINALVTQAVGPPDRAAPLVILALGTLPSVKVQPTALKRAISNLIDNARKYGGDEIAIETGVSDKDILIDVLDRGPGIPEQEVERMKRPFTRLENARTNATGTGLGLAIVERIANQHRGTLELLPRNGGGLHARLRLPIERSASTA